MSIDTDDAADTGASWTRNEHQAIVAWRRERLLASGFRPGVADVIAVRHDVDLHELLDLVDRGCPPELAARIVAPFDIGDLWR